MNTDLGRQVIRPSFEDLCFKDSLIEDVEEELEGGDEDDDDDVKCDECLGDSGKPERIDPGEDERLVKRLGDPRLPSKEEVEDHERTHLPYRNWCYHCIRGKGKDLDHRKEVKEERGLSEYSFDYCFPGDEFGFKLTVLIGRERERERDDDGDGGTDERIEWEICGRKDY